MESTLGMVALVLALLCALLSLGLAVRQRGPERSLPPVLLGLELARLAEHVRRVEQDDQPCKAERLAAGTLAYDLVLRDYCRSVDLPVPAGHGMLSRSQRFEMEAALISHGHDW